MKTLFENMLRSLVRFKTATLLNIIGMSVAFASFMIIMAQVRYDLTFDTGYANSGNSTVSICGIRTVRKSMMAC